MHFFLRHCAGLFAAPAFVNHHCMGAAGKTRAGQIRFAFLEQYVAGDTRMFGLSGERNDHGRLKFAPLDRVALYDDDGPFILLKKTSVPADIRL